jgi:pantetheine-phosphate adenylyltransferase
MNGKMKKKFREVGVGGTFDEFHRGHMTLLSEAFEVGEHVLIGLCSDDFVKKLHKPHLVAAYDQRLEDLRMFLKDHDWFERATIVALSDPFGPALVNGSIEALIVSKETEPTAKEINKRREKAGERALHVITIDMVPSENHSPISTTRIRLGEMDREGHLLKRKTD